MSTPRGIRNHNPGNVERTATQWRGMADDQSSDDRFIVFEAPQWGVRAIGRILQTYHERHGLDTVEGVLDRWAPPFENDTRSYVQHVADTLGVGVREPLDMDDPLTVRRLVKAIIRHENGRQPYSDDLIDLGLELAGYEFEEPDTPEPEEAPVSKFSKYVPDRKVLAGGVSSIAAFAVVMGLNAAGVEIGMEAGVGLVGAIGTVAAYVVPPSVQDVTKRIDDTFENVFGPDTQDEA